MSDTAAPGDDPATYGPNAWLIEEMRAQFQEFPESVGAPWKAFLSAGPATKEGETTQRASAARLPWPDDSPTAPPVPAPPPGVAAAAPSAPTKPGVEAVRGVAARIVENMEASLSVPTATSVRDMPVRLMEENRRVLNQVLEGTALGRLSFTHLIAWALLQSLRKHPGMTHSFARIDGAPHRIIPEHIHFGLAVDVEKKDGSRTLMVPNVKNADTMDFAAFLAAYSEVLEKVRTNRVMPPDFAGTTITLTNPGMIGTVHSIPRLMAGQGLIIATGSIAYPVEFQSADPRTLADLGMSKIMTVTSTYDHRVIQGAESGEFLRTVDRLLCGEDEFYDGIFQSLHIPHEPVRMIRDRTARQDLSFGGVVEKEAKVRQLINIYRVRGHLIANTNPLAREIPAHQELDPASHDLTVWDFDREFLTDGIGGRERLTLRVILETLRNAYCQTIGVEYMHIQEPDQKAWIRERVEAGPRPHECDLATKWRILNKLNAAEVFERFLHTKYVGHKRFSLEGAETLIPLLDALFTRALGLGIQEAVIGMAHRGRLNVLANVLGKSYERIFREFEGDLDPESLDGSGDVKYHLGATGTHTVPDLGTLQLTLASNPSHLEAVGPVVEGIVRAKQDLRGDSERREVLPVLIHGDAAFAGQGVVAETLNLADLKGYRTGGTVHIVVNNGIGFTTSPVDARSTVYPTDVARMVQAPIFHVNAHDPEACVHVINLALEFRQQFQKDVVVDMMCYRRHGHNEGDEPAFTQPLMYATIDKLRPVRLLYTESLVRRGDIREAEAEAALADFRSRLDAAFEATHDSRPPTPVLPRDGDDDDAEPSMETGVERSRLDRIAAVISAPGDHVKAHPKLVRQLAVRGKMLGDDAVDWATGEALAFGSLLMEGIPVRLSGQDSRRGTFAHRHSVLIDQETEAEYAPLNHLADGQAHFSAYDSLLSEYAVLGFDYGYSVSADGALVLWEAQFGDFSNGAQIILDQFVSSAYDKWGQRSRLSLLLPHGYEGQGPEHSSARLERFLTLCARRNMRVAMPTTAAQYFHLLRRQVHQGPSKPLIVMTPKSLLRAPSARSAAIDFEKGRFRLIMNDPLGDPEATRILLCSGKVAYDLMAFRDRHDVSGVVVVRFEQLYPFPSDDLREILELYPLATDIVWVQEEPMNMGPWSFMLGKLHDRLPSDRRLRFVGRPASGSPAAGSLSMHMAEQEYLIQRAFKAGAGNAS